jgi:hypothetical protein
MKKFNGLFKDERDNDGKFTAKFMTLNLDALDEDLVEAINKDCSDMSSDDMASSAKLYNLETLEAMISDTDNTKHQESLSLLVELLKSQDAMFAILDVF